MKPTLHLEPIGHNRAQQACRQWHYTRSVPAAALRFYGVWEDERFIGTVVYTAPLNTAGSYLSLPLSRVAALSRVALGVHRVPVSRIVAITLRLVKRDRPELAACLSYADPAQKHLGTIYQAMNWQYLGLTAPDRQYYYDGQWVHSRAIRRKVKSSRGLPVRPIPGKHRYLWCFDPAYVPPHSPLPYPKRAASIDSDVPASHAGEGGATPTAALQAQPEAPR